MAVPATSPTAIEWRSIIRAFRTPDVSVPMFAGLDHEDPETFLNQCERYFAEAAIEPLLWSRMVTKCLTDRAAKWYEVYRGLSLPWAKFRTLTTQHFAGVSARNKLHIKLYANKQEEKEAVGVFLQKKYLLALRMLPTASEEQIIGLLMESLKPSIRKVLRAATMSSFEDLIERALQAESDEADETSKKPTAARTAVATIQPAAPASATTAPRPRLQCHHCTGEHYVRSCPHLKTFPGNGPVRAAEAGAPSAHGTPGTPQS
ncbi:activity-regulated cytoskeleton-associated protein-like [Belonocnema kinseyi]|uniref:activity-regulated cytoskeleton-associated protein-like n=1 Tax=Belonocnema kinseyi TaxID=2817044 RepID=UPI00143DF956|nr:activity-regulated cytoskeleton-associated protein-like [Belonocnema kinseyi]